MHRERPIPLRGDCFHLEIEGISTAGFTRCTGLAAEVEVLEYREGGFEGVRAFRGRAHAGRILLERGIAHDSGLWDWYRAGDPRAGAVLLLDPDGKERVRWDFNGWPCRWIGPELDATTARVAVELLEIVHEGVTCKVR